LLVFHAGRRIHRSVDLRQHFIDIIAVLRPAGVMVTAMTAGDGLSPRATRSRMPRAAFSPPGRMGPAKASAKFSGSTSLSNGCDGH
jgi:hypothetical protein